MAVTKQDLRDLGVYVCAGVPPEVFGMIEAHAIAMSEAGYGFMIATPNLVQGNAGLYGWLSDHCGGPKYTHWQSEMAIGFNANGELLIGWLWGFSDEDQQFEFRLKYS